MDGTSERLLGHAMSIGESATKGERRLRILATRRWYGHRLRLNRPTPSRRG